MNRFMAPVDDYVTTNITLTNSQRASKGDGSDCGVKAEVERGAAGRYKFWRCWHPGLRRRELEGRRARYVGLGTTDSYLPKRFRGFTLLLFINAGALLLCTLDGVCVIVYVQFSSVGAGTVWGCVFLLFILGSNFGGGGPVRGLWGGGRRVWCEEWARSG